jgi:hypothetical protein
MFPSIMHVGAPNEVRKLGLFLIVMSARNPGASQPIN